MLLAASEVASHGHRSGGGPGPLFIILLLGLLGFFLVRRQRHGKGGGGGRHGTSPMGQLQARFASGEIQQAEFEHRRGVLRGDKNIPKAPADMAPPQSQTPAEPAPLEADVTDDVVLDDED